MLAAQLTSTSRVIYRQSTSPYPALSQSGHGSRTAQAAWAVRAQAAGNHPLLRREKFGLRGSAYTSTTTGRP
eukprot:jgi/Chlat1/8391/Chrsp80S07906